MKKLLQLEIDGQTESVQAEFVDKKIWFKIQDSIYSYDVLDLAEGTSRRTKAKAKSADKITAPMPGKVTKVFVTEGQEVQKGDALLVMEAMKMEYTLKSDLAAQVEKITAIVGQQVSLGQLLVQLKEIK